MVSTFIGSFGNEGMIFLLLFLWLITRTFCIASLYGDIVYDDPSLYLGDAHLDHFGFAFRIKKKIYSNNWIYFAKFLNDIFSMFSSYLAFEIMISVSSLHSYRGQIYFPTLKVS